MLFRSTVSVCNITSPMPSSQAHHSARRISHRDTHFHPIPTVGAGAPTSTFSGTSYPASKSLPNSTSAAATTSQAPTDTPAASAPYANSPSNTLLHPRDCLKFFPEKFQTSSMQPESPKHSYLNSYLFLSNNALTLNGFNPSSRARLASIRASSSR